MTRTFSIDRPIPRVLTKDELCDFTGYSARQIDRFRRLKNHPGIKELEGPGHPRFDGRALKAWTDGGEAEPLEKPRRRFFQKAG